MNQWERDKWHERTSFLDPDLDQIGLGGKGRERKSKPRKKEKR